MKHILYAFQKANINFTAFDIERLATPEEIDNWDRSLGMKKCEDTKIERLIIAGRVAVPFLIIPNGVAVLNNSPTFFSLSAIFIAAGLAATYGHEMRDYSKRLQVKGIEKIIRERDTLREREAHEACKADL